MQPCSLTFSIVIPTFNRPTQLAHCLRAVSNLDYPRDRFEVIVVDDGGREKLDGVCSEFDSKIEISLVQQENAGPAAARNTGGASAQGTYLAFTDDDCEVHPGWLTELEKLFSTYPDSMIGGKTINKLTENLYSRTSQLIVDIVYRYYNADPERARFLASNNMAVPAQEFAEVGRFDLSFFAAASEDRELCARWLAHGLRIVYSEDPIIYHAHELTLKGFCWQHFNYGRGAYCFHQVQKRKGIDYFRYGLKFHAHLDNWLLYPFRQEHRTAISLAFLLITWQFVNLFGFLWEAVHQRLNE